MPLVKGFKVGVSAGSICACDVWSLGRVYDRFRCGLQRAHARFTELYGYVSWNMQRDCLVGVAFSKVS